MPKPIDELKTSRAAIPSVAQANLEFRAWLAENDYHNIVDSDGQKWKLIVEVSEIPSNKDPKQATWTVKFGLDADVSVQDLVTTGVFKAEEDERLLTIIGERVVPLRMKPQQFECDSLEEARVLLSEKSQEFKDSFATKSMLPIKKALIGRFVDEAMLFSNS